MSRFLPVPDTMQAVAVAPEIADSLVPEGVKLAVLATAEEVAAVRVADGVFLVV